MLTADLPTLTARLHELADYYRVRPPGERAITIWYEGLRSFQIETVAGVLIDWPSHSKDMPTLSQVYPRCMQIRRGEAMRTEALSQPLQWKPRSTPDRNMVARYIAELRGILSHGPRDHLEWIRRGLVRIGRGEDVPHVCRRMILDAALAKGIAIEQFADADREAVEERLAIMAEGQGQ